jgi:low affinity Fe/Cu permease
LLAEGWPCESEATMRGRGGWLERASRKATEWTGSSLAFALAVGTIVVWGITGPFFHYSDTWQLVINTGTTIVTFLMVFLIQRAQNKDSAAIHLKLNELVAAMQGASNRLINAEELSEDEVAILRKHYKRLVELATKDEDFGKAHSVEEADAEHRRKKALRGEEGRGSAAGEECAEEAAAVATEVARAEAKEEVKKQLAPLPAPVSFEE